MNRSEVNGLVLANIDAKDVEQLFHGGTMETLQIINRSRNAPPCRPECLIERAADHPQNIRHRRLPYDVTGSTPATLFQMSFADG